MFNFELEEKTANEIVKKIKNTKKKKVHLVLR